MGNVCKVREREYGMDMCDIQIIGSFEIRDDCHSCPYFELSSGKNQKAVG